MIQGRVNSNFEAVITVEVRGPAGQAQRIDAVVDTGFTDFLTLPFALISELELALVGKNVLSLADGNEVEMGVFRVTISWEGEPRDVLAYAADATPLVGMQLLENHSLHIEIVAGGGVTIESISQV